MAVPGDYVVRETVGNLRHNVLMTTAAMLTVAVSLALVGGVLLLKQGVSNATRQWRGGVELSIFMKPEASASQTEAVEAELRNLPEVRDVRFVDQAAAFAEFGRMFASTPEMVDSVTPADLPASYRVVPREPEFAESVGQRFEARPGVREVVYAKEVVDTLLDVTRTLQLGVVAVAGVLLLSAALLILNTIRMAIFSRRREVAVMKLVGATNWFIRVPFMLEGLVQGLVGAAVAFAVVYLGRNLAAERFAGNDVIGQLVVSSGEVVGTGLFMLVVGAIVGTVGSGIAVSRFLDV